MTARTLVLHVGIHKTASTYIQHRLKRNQPFLRAHGLLYPKRRRDHLRLVQALRQGNMRPWARLLGRAERQGRTAQARLGQHQRKDLSRNQDRKSVV